MKTRRIICVYQLSLCCLLAAAASVLAQGPQPAVETAPAWGGPANAYVLCRDVRPGECLTLRWPVPHFKQVFVPQSAPGRDLPVTVEWLGNTVLGISTKGKYLPMFGKETGI